jgi:hypothetical protein
MEHGPRHIASLMRPVMVDGPSWSSDPSAPRRIRVRHTERETATEQRAIKLEKRTANGTPHCRRITKVSMV